MILQEDIIKFSVAVIPLFIMRKIISLSYQAFSCS